MPIDPAVHPAASPQPPANLAATPATPQGGINGAVNGVVRLARKVVISVIGVTVILAGVIMLVAPGPGMLTIALGIGILATEFVWAARVYKRIQDGAKTAKEAFLPAWVRKWMDGKGEKETGR